MFLVLGKPFQGGPLMVGFSWIHTSAVAEARHAYHMPFNGRECGAKRLGREKTGHWLERVEHPLQRGRAVATVGGRLIAGEELSKPCQRSGIFDRRTEIE